MDHPKAKRRYGKWPLRIAAVMLAALIAGIGAARADDAPILRDAWDVTIGGGAAYAPEYEGARHMQFEPRPYFDVTWYDVNGRERTFLNVDDGLGIYLLSTEHFRLGPLATWRFGRSESDSSDLRGLGNVDGGAQLGGLFEYQPHDCCVLFTKVRRDVGNESGLFADVGADLTAPIAPHHWYLNLRVTSTWADGAGMRPLFGVTSAQSSRSGLAAYSPSSGMRDVIAQPALIYDVDGHWAVAGRVTYERLLDGAADSPLLRTRGDANQFTYELLLTHHF
jgi:outer membrane scaffolding protein for murein synthesis (MipA/OmpV family)